MWGAVLAGALGCYGLKLAGVSVPARVLEAPTVRRVAALLPVALLAALVLTQTFAEGTRLVLDGPRAAGLGAALVALRLRAPFLVVVAAASATAAILRLLGA